ncbi:hypothetical protein AB0D38_05070 [Streptomyces sp. NPDC048279]|uniref:hypothetical protein n=1 Tax=Streptomyces sp. NPDC048279 TaxID=3154714 RepID=UPI00341D79D2
MTLWGGVLSLLAGRGGEKGHEPAAEASATSPLRVDTVEGVVLIRSGDGPPSADEVEELGRALPSTDGVSTVVVGADGNSSPELWSRLGQALDSLCEEGVSTVRLVMSCAGADLPDQPATAQQIADAWGLEVIAPEGAGLIVPGGSLFTFGSAATPTCGWRRFTPDAEPRALGARSPEPSWQEELERLPRRSTGGCVVEQIPAGVLVRPARARDPLPGDPCYAVPMDTDRPTLLVGTPGAEAAIPSRDLADLLTALPAATRSAIRLAPGDHRDLLPVAQDVADLLGSEVEVLTATPLAADCGSTAPDAPGRPVLLGVDGTPRWRPYVEAVVCQPCADPDGALAPAPRLLRWHPPFPGYGNAEPGTVHLSDRWQVSVTRAGLAVVPRGRSVPLAGQPVRADRMLIDIGCAGEPLDDSILSDLSRLLFDLDTDTREQAVLRVLGSFLDGGRRLRRLAVRHGVPLVPQTQTLPGHPPVMRGHTPTGAGTAPVTVVPQGRPVPDEPAPSPAPPGAPLSTEGAAVSSVVPPAPTLTGHGTTETAQQTPSATTTGPAAAATSETVIRPAEAAATPTAPTSSAPHVAAALLTEPSRSRPSGAPGPEPSHERTTHTGQDAPASAGREEGAAPRLPERPRTPPAPGPPASPVSAAPVRVPFGTQHRSTEAERAAFHELAGASWERHNAAVSRLLPRMPALRGHELEIARADLVAVHLYLTGGPGPLSREVLVRALRGDDDRLLPYAACLASGLRRLASYRGAVLRGGPDSPVTEDLVPGRTLCASAPVSGLPYGAARIPLAAVRYVIWSSMARRVRPLLGAGKPAEDELVFGSGSVFRVLDVRAPESGNTGPLVLLRELPGTVARSGDSSGALDGDDSAALARLEEALAQGTVPAGREYDWPERCTGPVSEAFHR